jgi:hypothetical protein
MYVHIYKYVYLYVLITEIISMNPGIERLERLSAVQLRGHLAPQQFPLTTIRTTIDMEYSRNATGVQCGVDRRGCKQVIEGNKYFASLMRALIPEICSDFQCAYDKDAETVTIDTWLDIGMSIPGWFPLPAASVEKSGSQIFQQSMDKDTDAFFDKIYARFGEWEASASASAALPKAEAEAEGGTEAQAEQELALEASSASSSASSA